MKKKLICMVMAMFMAISSSMSLSNSTAFAAEMDTVGTTPAEGETVPAEEEEEICRVSKTANEEKTSIQISLGIREDIDVKDVILPDGTKSEEDLESFVYTVDENGEYQFVLHYFSGGVLKEENITVSVTEIETKTDTTTGTTVGTEEGAEIQAEAGAQNPAQVIGEENTDIYVSSSGDDATGDGTKESPFATLAKAAEAAQDGAVVYVLDSLRVDDSVRIVNKSITIDGLGNVVTRGEVKQVQDNARSTYNPAMFEINNWDGDTASHVLTFKNIILDDDGKAAGSVYDQQSTDGSFQNEDKVQDAMIASYAANKIVLEEGTVLQNYGGLSAVRLTSGALLEMKNGAVIKDTRAIERGNHTVNAATGQMGAIWLQSGRLEMQEGASVQNMIGRAVMVDGGEAQISGVISNIEGRSTMWKGAQGIALHVRGEGKAVLSGRISEIKANTAGGDNVVAIRNDAAYFESASGSQIDKIENIPVLFANYSEDRIGGTVENCSFDYLFRGTYNDMVFTENALIQNNTCKSGAAKAVVYSTNGAKYTFSGRMKNNDASYAFYIINHGGTAAELIMEEGAELTGNGKNTGVYINASGCRFTMNGGEITGFSAGVYCRGKKNSPASFIMNGGRIYENISYGINFSCYTGSRSIVQLKGGTVENNGNTEIYMSSGQASDANEHVEIHSGVLGGNRNIELSPGTVSFDKEYEDVQIGSAKKEAVDKIKELVQADAQYEGWSLAGSSAYWVNPSSGEIHFKVTRPFSAKNTGLFVTYIPLKEDGTPTDDARLMAMEEVGKTNVLDVTLKGLIPDTAYAVMFVNNDTYTLNPDNVVEYTGGGQGQETSKTGFSFFTLTDSVDSIKSLEINGVDTGLQGQEALEKLYEYLTVTVTDEEGKIVTDDHISGDYIRRFSFKDSSTKIRINGNEVVLGSEGGKLIIRDTSDKKGAISGEITYPLLEEEPSERLDHAVAIAKMPLFGNHKFYINNDREREIEETQGISLFDDKLLALDENDNRQELLENRAKEYLGIKDQLGTITYFDFRYLDLVDAFNGNVWVSAGSGTTVYIPYPEGVDESTDFQLVHFMGLHREQSLKNQDDVIEAVKNCQLETMEVEKTPVGIKFDVGSSGFSPFAVVWSENTGAAEITVQYIDKETNKPVAEDYEATITVNASYDVTDYANLAVPGYHIDSINGQVKGQMTKDGVVVTVNYLNDAPVITAKDITLQVGDDFHALNNATAKDTEDGDLTKDIQIVENTVNTSCAGTYQVVYKVADSIGKTTTLTVKVEVKDNSVDASSGGGRDQNSVSQTKDVQTGDRNPLGLFALIAGTSLAAAVILAHKRKLFR